MRKRSKYRPKGVMADPLGFVLGGFKSVAEQTDELLAIKIRVHAALAALTQGKATLSDISELINAANICEALYRMGFGSEYQDELRVGLDSLYNVGKRGMPTGKFILRADEMTALNVMVELHDAQLEVITVADLYRAIKLVDKEQRSKKMRSIKS